MKMSKKEMVTFAMGDLFGGGAQLVIGFFYLRFLTDVVRINPILAGTVILLSKIWDAISDPIMGNISDNTRTKFGRRKPYLLSGVFLIVIAFTILWYSPNITSQFGKFVFVAFSYLFFSTVSTIVMVPYTAMSSEISMDIKERGRVNGMRLFFSQMSSLVGAVLPMVIVGMFPERLGYLVMGLVFSLFYAMPFLGIFFWCQERVPTPTEKAHFSLVEIISPLKIRTYRVLIGMYLSAFFVMDVVSAIFAYYMTYMIGREDLLEMVLGVMLLTQIAALALVVLLSERIGKPNTFIVGASIFIAGSIALGFYSTSWPIVSLYVISAVVGLGLIGCIVMPWVMFPDVTDISMLVFGERRSGAFAGFMTFLRKFSSAIGIWMVGFVLQFSGYILPGDVIVPIDSNVWIDEASMIVIDLEKDKTHDIKIDLENKTVYAIPANMSYKFYEDRLEISENNKLVVVIENELKVTKAYNFDESATVKTIKSFNQPKSFILGLRATVFLLPTTLLLFAIALAKKYPLTEVVHKRLLKHYDAQHDDSIEAEALKNILL